MWVAVAWPRFPSKFISLFALRAAVCTWGVALLNMSDELVVCTVSYKISGAMVVLPVFNRHEHRCSWHPLSHDRGHFPWLRSPCMHVGARGGLLRAGGGFCTIFRACLGG